MYAHMYLLLVGENISLSFEHNMNRLKFQVGRSSLINVRRSVRGQLLKTPHWHDTLETQQCDSCIWLQICRLIRPGSHI